MVTAKEDYRRTATKMEVARNHLQTVVQKMAQIEMLVQNSVQYLVQKHLQNAMQSSVQNFVQYHVQIVVQNFMQ